MTTIVSNHDHDYSALLSAVTASFDALTRNTSVVFQTDAGELFDLYMDSLSGERQLHNCNTCRRFLDKYGGLVIIDDAGDTIPIMWSVDEVPDFYRPVFHALSKAVKRARVWSVFHCSETVWGTPVTGDWSHLSAVPPPTLIYRERVLTAGQAMAACRENYRTVAAALDDFIPAMLDEALRLLSSDSLARSERFIEPVRWLRALHDRPKGRCGDNLLWRAVALAPVGFCHPRGSVVGSLLEDIAAGLPFSAIKARFDAKLAPLAYQRPQVAPSVGNIRAAEDLFAKLVLEPALHRRYARLDEVPTIWRPKAEKGEMSTGGIFGHLAPKSRTQTDKLNIPVQTMTWEKFSRKVLPTAEQIKIVVPHHGRFIALTTAELHDTPPVLKWDHEDERNPLAWYVYHHGSPAEQWGLNSGTLVNVTGIARFPNLLGSKPMPELAEGVVLLIEGAVDRNTGVSAGPFPECLKAELYSIRSVIEAYSRSATLGGRSEASACGYDMRKSAADVDLKVFEGGAWNSYRIDRWD